MRPNETGILSIHWYWVQLPLLQLQSFACSPWLSDGCACILGREKVGAGQWDCARDMGQSTPVQQGQGQKGEKVPGKLQGKPGALTVAQPYAWPPPNPAPNWGCQGLELPARSCVTALAQIGNKARSLVPSPSPDPAVLPLVSFLGSELKKRKAQISTVTQVT